jgi:benzoyl-CoA reductase/2-hydroxyglutaryl-CoA dehydratase subunit BcrC/BadD/HgdB
MMYYDELLRLCGYEPEEIERERPRIEKTFEKLEFNRNDLDRGEERVRYYYDIELHSVRKMLGLWLKSLIDLVLAKEEGKKVVYTCMPPFFHILNGLASLSDDLYVTSPDITFSHGVGGIFGKLIPFLEAAEVDLLPAGSAFCSPIQAKLGAIIKGVIPIPDLLVSSGFVCDQSPKLDELLGIEYGIPVVYSDGPNDAYEKSWPQVSDRRVQYITQESEAILKRFEAVLGYRVTEEEAKRADLRTGNIATQCNRIFDLVKKADPTPTGFVNLGGVARLAKLGINTTTISGDPEGLVNLFYAEIRERVSKGEGSAKKGAPRVGIVTFPSIPEPTKMIEESGLAVVVDFAGLASTEADLVDSSYGRYWERGSETLLRFNGIRHAIRVVQVCREWDLDGAILNYPIGCRDLCMETLKSRELITKELGIPVLVIEADLSDPRNSTSEAVRNRIAAFAEILKSMPKAR